jgi:peptidyl-prolyl cis-trans isomerase C
MKKTVMVVIIILIALAGRAFAGNSLVVAKIGQSKITVADLNRIIGYYSKDKQAFIKSSPRNVAALLARIVHARVLSDIAKKKGFDKRPEIGEQVELLTDDFLASQFLKAEAGNLQASEGDVKLYYKAHKDEYKTPEVVRVRHILIKIDNPTNSSDVQRARERAEGILKRIKAGEDFAKLASEFSDDSGSKANGGDLGFIPRGKVLPAIDNAVFSLKPGEVSDLVKTPYGFEIMKVEEIRPPAAEAYEKVRVGIKEKLSEDLKKAAADRFIEQAMKDEHAEINFQALSSEAVN